MNVAHRPPSHSQRSGDGTLTPYPVVINHPLMNYATGELIEKSEGAIRRYVQQSNQSDLEYKEGFRTKVPQLGGV